MAIGKVAPTVTSRYYSGQGICMMGTRNPTTGEPEGLLPIGNVPALEIGIAETSENHKEAWTGQRGVDRTYVTETTVNVTMTFESMDPVNLALGLKASLTERASATQITKSVKLFKGKWAVLPHVKVSNVILATTNPDKGDIVDTDIEVDEAGGMVRLKAAYAGTVTDGTKIAFTYDHAKQLDVQALTVSEDAERYFVFRGLNTDDGKAVRLTIPRLRVAPFGALGKINDGIAGVEVTCNALADEKITEIGASKYFSEIWES